ncbi:MAG TPA: prepilin-type N-terminal cleavage/methylation domain-containing protein [Anaeromyxobacteraceae bacterium]|nr:prepilin-type N-terminal cleavage/methylation domain-containing protein [Anaeromyxobacteraceae bacterium]
MSARRATPRGVTLVELVVAMAVTALVMLSVLAIVESQQRAYYQGHRQRAAQSAARAAMLFLEQELITAGYGLDAPLAFDFDRYHGPCPAEMGACPRDATDNADEIVFYSRNPRYWVPDDYTSEPRGKAWRITALGIGSVSVMARPGDVFLKGQVLQAVCRGAGAYAYFTVETTAEVTPDPLDPFKPTPITLSLAGTLADEPFRRQDGAADACFNGGQARMFQVDRRRFHVRPVQSGGAWVPYLVLDAGVDENRDGTIDSLDEVILAEGIEVLQFGYVLTSNALAPRGAVPGKGIPMVRAASGTLGGDGLTLLDFPGLVEPGVSIYRPSSFYGYTFGPPPANQRLTDHQGNIRAVRIAVGARSPTPAPSSSIRTTTIVPVMNMDALPAWVDTSDHYARVTLTTAVPIRNMAVRAMTDF